MIYETGRIVAIEGDQAWVETRQNSACGACVAKSACGQGLLNSLFSGKRHYIRVDLSRAEKTVKLHDEVELAIAENVMLKGSFRVYLLPLATMIAAAIGAQYLWPAMEEDLAAIVGALVGFASGLLLVRLHSNRHVNDPAYQPVLNRVINSADSAHQADVVQVKP